MSKKAIRRNSGKLRWSLVDFSSLEEMLKVLEWGAEHYGFDNWKKGLHREEILESIQRHTIKLLNKEEVDTETGISHAAHIMCNTIFYLYHHRNNSFSKERNNPFKKKVKNKNQIKTNKK